MTWSEYLLADLHGPEEAAVSGRHLVGACWPRKLPTAHTFAAHRLCHALEACDLAICVILGPFLADAEASLGYGLGEVQRVYGLLDFVSTGRPGYGLVHLFVEFVFAWDSGEEGRFRLGQHPTRMLAGPLWHLRATILDDWRFWSYFQALDSYGGSEWTIAGCARNLHAALRLLDATDGCGPAFFCYLGPVSANEEVLGLPSWRDPLGVPVARLDCFLGGLDTAIFFWSPLVSFGLLGILLRRGGSGMVFPPSECSLVPIRTPGVRF